MTDLYALEFNGEDDYIPDAALDKLDGFWRLMPDSWEVKSIQAHQKSVTVTIAFDGLSDPFAQAEAFDRLAACATVVGTLARNLRAARNELAKVSA